MILNVYHKAALIEIPFSLINKVDKIENVYL